MRGRLTEYGLVVAISAAAALTAVAIAASWGDWYWLLGAGVALVLAAIMSARHRKPVAAAASGLALALVAMLVARFAKLPQEPSPAGILVLAVLLGTVVRRTAYPAAAAVAAGGLALVLAVFVAGQPTGGEVNVVAALNALGFAGGIGIGLVLRLADRTRQETEDRVRRDERLELARELHDVAAHHLTGLVLQAQGSRILARKRPEELDDSLATIESAGSEALTALRRVVGLLRDADDALSTRPAPEQVRDLVERFERHGPAVRLDIPAELGAWPPEVTGTVHRLVRESLTNVSRHAPQANDVAVTVRPESDGVHVEITDDGPAPGRPGRPARRSGYGLIGMQERVESLGGTFRAGPRDNAGWSVFATLPMSGDR